MELNGAQVPPIWDLQIKPLISLIGSYLANSWPAASSQILRFIKMFALRLFAFPGGQRLRADPGNGSVILNCRQR